MRLAVTGLALALAGIAAPMQAQTTIMNCNYQISAPGNYVLGANLSCSSLDGIDIESSNVQLNLNGHTITAIARNIDGIAVDPLGVGLSGIQIQGPGLIEHFSSGIDINPTGDNNDNNIQISKVTAALNNIGLSAANVTGLQLQQNVFAQNSRGHGAELETSTNGQIQQNNASGNGVGIALSGGSGNRTCRITPPTRQ